MDTNINVSQVIGRLGGTCAVAEIFGIKPPSVSEWISRGQIPKARLMYLHLARPDAFSDSDDAAVRSTPKEPA